MGLRSPAYAGSKLRAPPTYRTALAFFARLNVTVGLVVAQKKSNDPAALVTKLNTAACRKDVIAEQRFANCNSFAALAATQAYLKFKNLNALKANGGLSTLNFI